MVLRAIDHGGLREPLVANIGVLSSLGDVAQTRLRTPGHCAFRMQRELFGKTRILLC